MAPPTRAAQPSNAAAAVGSGGSWLQTLYNVALVLFLIWWFAPMLGINIFGSGSFIAASERIKNGEAVLVDIREAGEWSSGVAEPAYLLSMSALNSNSKGWQNFLRENKGKEIIVYCRSGTRAMGVRSTLSGKGFKATNLGSFNGWVNAGLPTRQPTQEELRG